MLENTDKAVADLLNKLPEIIQGASDQLPDIAKEMLIYGAFDANMYVVIGLITAIPMLICATKWLFSYDSEISGSLSLLLFVISLSFISMGARDLYKIEHAPKLYLIEKAASFVKLGDR